MIDLSTDAADPLWHALAVGFRGTKEQILERNRHEPLATVRCALMVAAVNVLEFTHLQAAREFDRERSNVSAHVQAHEGRMDYDNLYREAYTTIEEELIYE